MDKKEILFMLRELIRDCYHRQTTKGCCESDCSSVYLVDQDKLMGNIEEAIEDEETKELRQR